MDAARAQKAPLIELTYNWDPEDYTGGRNFGHLAYRVDDIYALCTRLQDLGIPSIVRRETGIWLLSKVLMGFQSSCCNPVMHSHHQSHGCPCPIQGLGEI